MGSNALEQATDQPGAPSHPSFAAAMSQASASRGGPQVGERVAYLGHIEGGPPSGASGRVKGLRIATVVVDFGRHGVWHVPPYLLSRLPDPRGLAASRA